MLLGIIVPTLLNNIWQKINLSLYDGDIFITLQVPEFEVMRGFIKSGSND